jgi:hypothetical protein
VQLDYSAKSSPYTKRSGPVLCLQDAGCGFEGTISNDKPTCLGEYTRIVALT